MDHKLLCLIVALFFSSLVVASGPATEPSDSDKTKTVSLHLPGDCDVSDESRFFKLENGLKVLLLSDTETNYTSVALDVAVGYRDDPKDLAGMAHFIEHMLFLGTEHYPEPDAWRTFVEHNGGSSNASVRFHSTDYRFSIETPMLDEALAMFSDQFRAPLISAQYVAKEKQAIAAEFSYRKTSIYRQMASVAKEVFFADHPFGKFGTGNEITLGGYDDEALAKKMRQWWSDHYGAENMSLVIHSDMPIEKLETLVQRYFASIKRGTGPSKNVSLPANVQQEYPRIAKAHIDDDERALLLYFPLPHIKDESEYAAYAFIAHLLSRKLPDSLLASLKAKKYTNKMDVSVVYTNPEQPWLEVYVDLYYKGGENYWEVIKQLFYYVDLLKQSPIEEWQRDEFNVMKAIDWCFREDVIVTRYAQNLNLAPPEFALGRDYMALQYAPHIYQTLLEAIRIEDMRAVVAHPHFSGSNKTPWYDVEYEVETLEEKRQRHFMPKESDRYYMQRPALNPYFPKDVKLAANNAQSAPQKLDLPYNIDAWHALDTSYEDPRAKLYFELRSPVIDESRKNVVLRNLLWSFLRDQLKFERAMVKDANGSLTVSRIPGGLGFYLSGFPDSIDLMLERIIQRFNNFKVQDRDFRGYRYGWTEYYKEFEEIHPQTQANQIEKQLLHGSGYDYSELQKGARAARYSNLKSLLRDWKHTMQLVTLSYGNVSEEQARDWNKKLALTLQKGEGIPAHMAKETIALKPGIQRVLSESQYDDSLVSIVIQGSGNSFAEQSRFMLLAKLISEDFFTQLRTEKQKGYYIDTDYVLYRESPALRFRIQSPNAEPHKLEQEMLSFIDSFDQRLNENHQDSFFTVKNILAEEMRRDPVDLDAKANDIWRSVANCHGHFTYRSILAERLTSLTLSDFSAWFRERFKAPQRRALVTIIVGENHDISSRWQDQIENSLVEDYEDFVSSSDKTSLSALSVK
ncbi:MAG: insulinase family protein [Oleiphilaceae bacterium]|nr:insulinase family protein [Oleiphilaceae bacterium]